MCVAHCMGCSRCASIIQCLYHVTTIVKCLASPAGHVCHLDNQVPRPQEIALPFVCMSLRASSIRPKSQFRFRPAAAIHVCRYSAQSGSPCLSCLSLPLAAIATQPPLTHANLLKTLNESLVSWRRPCARGLQAGSTARPMLLLYSCSAMLQPLLTPGA
jgi:hypothetical protein